MGTNVDEAQEIPLIGLNLKLIVDHIPNVRVIATGSSSFPSGIYDVTALGWICDEIYSTP